MDKICLYLIPLLVAMNLSMHADLYKVEKQLKELKELKMTLDNVESQLKILTPPPEFMQLPVVRKP